jgi:hypothetical protein
MTRDLSIRVAVGNAAGRHSMVWSVFSTKNEVYAAHRTRGGIEKFSFHSSRICRRAYVDTRPLPPTMGDRVLHRWTRAETLPAGQSQAVAVLTVFFPEAHLSPDLPRSAKKVLWLPPPMPSEARFLQVLFTREKKEDVRAMFEKSGHLFVAYHSLPNGESIAIRSWANEFERRDLIVEAGHGVPRDLVLPSGFENGVKRPVAFTTYSQVDEMRCLELSGYWVPAGEARRRFPVADRISRTLIIDRDGTGV